ncbi:MAG: hypothetical protein Q8L48_42655 [Archangium sp.]|nr:hypothetical protein [Archangium sp.]
MFALVVAIALAQAPVEPAPQAADAPVVQPAAELSPPPPPPPAAAPVPPEALPNELGRKPGFFSAPRVEGDTMAGRVGMGLLFGSLLGGAVATGFLGIGGLFTALSGSAGPIIVTAPFAIASLGVGTALGAAMFGKDYGRDLADAIGVALICALVSVAAVLVMVFIGPSALTIGLAAAVGLVFPAVATPLLVQAFKNDAPEPGVAVATF